MIDEKYYLSESMTRYVLDVDGNSIGGGWCKDAVVNPKIAHAITVQGVGGRQRCGVENYVVVGLPQDTPVEVVIDLMGLKNEEQNKTDP